MPRGVPTLGWSLYLRQLRLTRKAMGLCRDCSAKVEPGFTACARHLALKQHYKRKRVAA